MSRPLSRHLRVSLLISIVLTAAVCSRNGPAPAAPATAGGTIAEIASASRRSPPVIFIGLDGADWQLLSSYLDAGTMPNLKRLVSEGVAGTVDTLHPPLSPLIWTTMMTGVDPLRHRILDFVRFNPATGQKEPITSDERQAPAIWNMANWAGRSVAVFGLWGTYPAEPVNGLMVSDRLFTFLFKESQPPEGVVAPREEEAGARSTVQAAERSIGHAELKAYLPWLTEAEYASAAQAENAFTHPVSALRRILVETKVYDDLAGNWLQRHQPDLTLIYIQGTDSIGHTFAPFAPPRQPSIDAADFTRYSDVPRRYFAAIDALLGRYRALAESRGAVLMLGSDHGFAWVDDRPVQLSSNAQATAAKWHHKQGIYLLWGPGIAAKGRDPAATGHVGQVCATLLALLGLPPAKGDAAGPLPGAPVAAAAAIDYASHYRPPAAATASGGTRAVDEETLARLRALGYIGAAESDTGNRQLQTSRTAGSYNNEALLLKAQGRIPETIAAFENALIVDPNLASALWNLSDLLFQNAADLDRSDLLLIQAYRANLPEGTKYLIGRAIGYQRKGDINRSVKLLEAALRARPEDPEVWLFLGRYRVERGECAAAVSDFEKATRLAKTNAGAFASLGLARLCAGDAPGARQDLRRSLELDPSQAAVRQYLGKLGGS